MFYLDKVLFMKRTVSREFPTMSTWTNEDNKKRIEDKDRSNGFRRGVVEPSLDVSQPT